MIHGWVTTDPWSVAVDVRKVNVMLVPIGPGVTIERWALSEPIRMPLETHTYDGPWSGLLHG